MAKPGLESMALVLLTRWTCSYCILNAESANTLQILLQRAQLSSVQRVQKYKLSTEWHIPWRISVPKGVMTWWSRFRGYKGKILLGRSQRLKGKHSTMTCHPIAFSSKTSYTDGHGWGERVNPHTDGQFCDTATATLNAPACTLIATNNRIIPPSNTFRKAITNS